ncbi:glycine n-acyltransferase [Plakobranchus ocellatus]|uniref:Glycine N-acyltransferase-like protein n=1 Tax=Plakobranchus ocellatus TaxID=259542 RepID=A0AAV3YVF2_9GAST|nr:glycine n-acyltransferase [Plakobranchus ocellatus]
MTPTLHRVTTDELPALKDWLEKYLPESRKIFFTVLETIRGRWQGTVFYTLGWPDILAVGEGLIGLEDSPCALYFRDPRTTSIYSPSLDHAETLLLYPGFLDWKQPIIFQAVTRKLRPVLQKLSTQMGGNQTIYPNIMVEATEDDMPERPVPEGFELRPLDPDKHTDVVLTNWPHGRRHTDLFIKELLRRFPSIGLFNKEDGECVGAEIRYESGSLGMLFVKEKFRGKGFGKLISSTLSQSFFREGDSSVGWVIESNESSVRMHTGCGYKIIKDKFDYFIHHMETQKAYYKRFGYGQHFFNELPKERE